MNRGKKKQTMLRRMTAVLLVLCLVCNYQIPAMAETAATLKMQKTEGTVKVANNSGKSLSLIQNMSLYNGYQVATEAASYAWINLDDTKLTKLDEVSDMEIRSKGKELELLLNSGNLYFNVTAPLTEDETLNIRTSSMVMGIRGTAGWVKVIDRWHTRVYLLEGTLQCAVTDPVSGQRKSIVLHGGDMAEFVVYDNRTKEGDKCDIFLRRFTEEEIDGFVLVELVQDEGLCRKIYADSGLNILPLVDQAQDRLAADQAAMRQKLAEIQEKVQQQANHISVDPVWTDNQRNNDSDDSSGSSTPALGETVVLTMPVTAQMVHDTLATNGVRHVIIQPSDQGVSFGDARSFQARQMVAGKIIGRTVQMWAPVSTSVKGIGAEDSESGIAAQANADFTVTVQVTNMPERGYFLVGEEAIFEINVTNIGDQRLQNIVVNEMLAGAVLNPGNGYTVPDDREALVSELGVGENIIIGASYVVTRSDLPSYSFRNTVSVTAETEPGEDVTLPPVITADSGLIPIEEAVANFGVTVQVTNVPARGYFRVGEEAVFEIDVINIGNLSLQNIVISEMLAEAVVNPGDGYTVQEDTTALVSELGVSEKIIIGASYVVTRNDMLNRSFRNTVSVTAEAESGGDIMPPPVITADSGPIPAGTQGGGASSGSGGGGGGSAGVEPDILMIDVYVQVPSGKTLSVKSGVNIRVLDGRTLQIDGGLDMAGDLENIGRIENASTGTFRVEGILTNQDTGVIYNAGNGRIEASNWINNYGTFTNHGIVEGGIENSGTLGTLMIADGEVSEGIRALGGTLEITGGVISNGCSLHNTETNMVMQGGTIRSGTADAALTVDTGLEDASTASVQVDLQAGIIDGESRVAVNLVTGYVQIGRDVQVETAAGSSLIQVDEANYNSNRNRLTHFSDRYVDSGGVREITPDAVFTTKEDGNGNFYLEKADKGLAEALEAAQSGEIVTAAKDSRIAEADAEIHILAGEPDNPVRFNLNGKTIQSPRIWIGNGYEDIDNSDSGALEIYDSWGGCGKLVLDDAIHNSKNSSLVLKHAVYTHCEDIYEFRGYYLVYNEGHLEIQDGAILETLEADEGGAIEDIIFGCLGPVNLRSLGLRNGNSHIEIGTEGETVQIRGNGTYCLVGIADEGESSEYPERPNIVLDDVRMDASRCGTALFIDGISPYVQILGQAEIRAEITSSPSAVVSIIAESDDLVLDFEEGAVIKNDTISGAGSQTSFAINLDCKNGDKAETCIHEALEKGVEIKSRNRNLVAFSLYVDDSGNVQEVEPWRLSDYKVSDEPDEEGYYYYVKADPARAIQPLLATPSQAEMILDEDIQGEQEELPNADDSREKGEYVSLATPSQAEEISHEDLILDEEMIFDEDLILDEDALPDDDPVDEDDQDGNEEERGKPFVNFARDTESSVEKDLEISLSEEAEDSGSSKAEPYPEKEAAALPEGKKRGDQEEASLPEDNLQGDQEHSALPEIYVRDDEDSADRPEEKRQSSEIPILPDEMFQVSQETAPPEEQPEAALTGQEEEGSE